MPATLAINATSTIQVTEVNMANLYCYENPADLPAWQWVASIASFKHVGNGIEAGVWEMMVYINVEDEDAEDGADDLADAPEALLPIIAAARKAGSTWLMFHQN